MKKLLILPLLLLLTGCVTYYYPETAYEDGVYYAEDDPSYVVYSDGYTDDIYYPWSSIDFFYTGYYPYARYSMGWSYYGGFSIGFGYAYSPWYYPYSSFGYYYPWHHHHHHHAYYPYGRPYKGYCSGHYGCDKKKKHRGGKHDRYAKGGARDRYDGDDDYSDQRHPKYDSNESDFVKGNNASVRRYVSTAPSGHSSSRGMVVRSNESTKIGKSRLEPDKTAPVASVTASPSVSRVSKPKYDTSGLGNDIRYRSDAKQSRSKTGPVDQSVPVRSVRVEPAASQSRQPTSSSRRSPAKTQTSKSSRSTASSGSKRARSAPARSSSKGVSKNNHSSRRDRRD